MRWQMPLLTAAYSTKDFKAEHLALMRHESDAALLMAKLEKAWLIERERASRKSTTPSLLRAFLRAFLCRFLDFSCMGTIGFILIPVSIASLSYIVSFLEDDASPWWEGLAIISFFFVMQLVSFFLRQYFLFYNYVFILVMRKSTTALLYKKLLRLSPRAVSQATTGKIVNLASGDVSLLEKSFSFIPFLVISPAVFVFSITFIALQVSPP